MKSLRELNKCAWILFLLVICSFARADAVITNAATSFGSVVSFDSHTIEFQTGCSGPKITVSWADVLVLRFDNQCLPHKAEAPTAPLQICKEALVHVFKLRYQGKFVYLRELSMAPNGGVRGIPFGKNGGISLHRKQMELIQPTDVCPSKIEASSLPKGICFEPLQFAVNWALEPVFNNEIFTKGFSIYIRSRELVPAQRSEEITRALGTALTLWGSTLEKNKDDLPPQLRSYIEHSTARGGQVILYTPPQVIQVQCPENATLIVDWVSRDGIFPKGQGYVAEAQLQGRTVLLNASENTFGYRPDIANPLPPDTASLVSVFVHEMGHCLGLRDEVDDATSVMNPNYVARVLNQTVEPSHADFLRFRSSLEASVRGTAPGFFDVKDCAGLRRPSKGNSPAQAEGKKFDSI